MRALLLTVPLSLLSYADARAAPGWVDGNAKRIDASCGAERSFALAQALWETGGVRDRDRSRALIEQAVAGVPGARAIYEADREAYGAQLARLERHIAQLEAWQRTHR